jgi:hypothetical protein
MGDLVGAHVSAAARSKSGLGTLFELVQVGELVAAWEREAVALARAQGATWDEVGEVLGLRRQAVWVRYGKEAGTSASAAARPGPG